MLTSTEYLGKVWVGVTIPIFLKADNNQIYIVKLAKNPLGKNVLINELLGYLIGQKFNLIFPPSDIIMINQNLAYNISSNKLHFASQYIYNCSYVTSENVVYANNLSEMAGIILFDHMFHNADRINNLKNLLISTEENNYRIYAIDNSHLFSSTHWTNRKLRNFIKRN